MNEISNRKRNQEIKSREWHAVVAKAQAERAAFLDRFEGRTPNEKYKLAIERAKVARQSKSPEK